jgi:hypothetical protein
MSQPFWDRKQSFSSANGLNDWHWKQKNHITWGPEPEKEFLIWPQFWNRQKTHLLTSLGNRTLMHLSMISYLGTGNGTPHRSMIKLLGPETEPLIGPWWELLEPEPELSSVHEESAWDRKWHPTSNHDDNAWDLKRNPSSVHDERSSLSSLWLLTGEEGWLCACWCWWCALGAARHTRLRNFENLNRKIIISTLSSP